MKIRIGFAAIVAIACAQSANADITETYGWEDGGVALGYSGNINEIYNDNTFGNGSSSSLYFNEDPLGGTPQVWLGAVSGLTEGDTVTASFWVYDVSEGGSPSVRIWGHYTDMSDGDWSSSGSASGSSTYPEGTGWEKMEHTWTIAAGRDALVIEGRLYSNSNGNHGIIDDLTITTNNDNATMHFAPAPGALALLGLAGIAGRRRRR